MIKKIKLIVRQLINFAFPSFQHEDILEHVERRTFFYKNFLQKDDLVFDVGANIGNRIVAFMEIGAKVVAIEPQIKCIKQLKKRFGTKIFYENIGLAEKEGILDFYISNAHTLSTFSTSFIKKTKDSGRFSNFSWNTIVQVEVKTLEQLIQKYGVPKFIKIDTEGFELSVIKGLYSRVSYISFEYTLPELKENLQEIINYFSTFGNIYINFSVGESMEMSLDQWIDSKQFIININNDDAFYKAMGEFGDVYVNMK